MVAALSLQEKEAIFSTLKRIFNNIIQNPNDDQYCQIKLTSKTFRSKVWQHPGSDKLMKISGWVVEGDHIKLKDGSLTQVALAIITLQVSDSYI